MASTIFFYAMVESMIRAAIGCKSASCGFGRRRSPTLCSMRRACPIGVKTRAALSVIVEIGDFKRLPSDGHFAANPGLIHGENFSGAAILRTRLVESAQVHVRASGFCITGLQ